MSPIVNSPYVVGVTVWGGVGSGLACVCDFVHFCNYLFTTICYFYQTTNIGEKETTSEGVCLFSSYNPIQPGTLRHMAIVNSAGLSGKARRT